MTLQEIRQRKAAKVAEQRAMLAKAQTENRNLTAEESAKFDSLKGEVIDLEAAETRQQFVDEQERRASGTPVHNAGNDTIANLESRVSLLDVVAAQVAGRALTGAAAEYAQEAERRSGRKPNGVFVPLSVLEKRTNLTTTAPEIVQTVHRGDQFVGPLRDSLVVRQMGVRVLSDLTGVIEIPKWGSGLTAAWVSENEAIATSDMTFDKVSLSPRHVGAISSWSRQLAQTSNPSIEALLRDDLAFVIGAAVDKAIVSGDGVKEPQGIIGATGVQTGDVPTTWEELLELEGLLDDINVRNAAWYTSPAFLRPLRATLKSDVAGAEYIATRKSIGELPAYTSNAAPDGTGILGDWSQVILGTWGTLDVLVNPYESAAYSRGNVLIRAMMTCDTVLRHPQAFVVAAPETP